MKLVGVFFFSFMSMVLWGQYGQQRLFAELEGEELLEQVVSEYKATIQFFDYGTSRDTMFREVYAVNDSLECVYSGHKLYMDPSKDPTTTVYMNGSDNGINTEHTYPRSKGASYGNALVDMHHLFPTRALVNEERSNFPFGDIPDDSATKWFWKDQTLINKPTDDLDKYSEWKWQTFEPRESHKGNVARAVMYFYTMYKAQSDAEDPDFFWDMLPDLCQWHFEDPVDSAEYVRTNLIAKWQQFPNPFVLDCSLVSRTYCADIMDEACELAVPVQELTEEVGDKLSVYYDAASKTLTVLKGLRTGENNQLLILDISGRKLQSINSQVGTGLEINLSHLASGNYVLQVVSDQEVESILFSVF